MSDHELPEFHYSHVIMDDEPILLPPDVPVSDRIRAYLDEVKAPFCDLEEHIRRIEKQWRNPELRAVIKLCLFTLRMDIIEGPRLGVYNRKLSDTILHFGGDIQEDRYSLRELRKAYRVQRMRSLGTAATNLGLGWSRLLRYPPIIKQLSGALDEFHELYMRNFAQKATEWDEDHVKYILNQSGGVDGLYYDNQRRKEEESRARDEKRRADRQREIERARLEGRKQEAERQRRHAESEEKRRASEAEAARLREQLRTRAVPLVTAVPVTKHKQLDETERWQQQPTPDVKAARSSFSIPDEQDAATFLTYLSKVWSAENCQAWVNSLRYPDSFHRLRSQVYHALQEIQRDKAMIAELQDALKKKK